MKNRKHKKQKKMPNTVELDITSVDVDVNPTNDVQTITLVMTYLGQADLAAQIIQGERLVIEIPSHAPPPTP